MGSKKRPKGKHTNIVNYIVKRLENSNTLYDIIENEQDYDDPISGKHGECDVYAVADNYLFIFEIKSFDKLKNKNSAYGQCNKDQHYFTQIFDIKKTYCFYVHGFPKNNLVKINWIKENGYRTKN